MAPIRPGTEERVSKFRSYAEASPRDILRFINVDWETTAHWPTASTTPLSMGHVLSEDGQHTGALPGKVVHHSRCYV